MKFFKILICLLLFIAPAMAKEKEAFDLRYEGFVRTNPIGAYARAEAGYSFGIWDANHPKAPLYGFVRPMVQFQTSGLINSANAFFEFYPISFFGFYVGKSFMRRDLKKLDNYDCDDTPITCKSSEITRNIWGMKFALKLGNFFIMNRFQWHTTNIGDRQSLSFADEQGTLIGSGTKDKLFQFIQVGGYDITEKYGVGYLHKRNLMKNSRQDSSMTAGLYKRVWKDEKGRNYTLLAGPGIFHTRQGTDHLMGLAILQVRDKSGWTVF